MGEEKKQAIVEKILGDFNQDGRIGIEDVNELIDKLLKLQDDVRRFDINEDGKVTIADLTTAIDHIMSDDTVTVNDLTELIDYLLVADAKVKELDIN